MGRLLAPGKVQLKDELFDLVGSAIVEIPIVFSLLMDSGNTVSEVSRVLLKEFDIILGPVDVVGLVIPVPGPVQKIPEVGVAVSSYSVRTQSHYIISLSQIYLSLFQSIQLT